MAGGWVLAGGWDLKDVGGGWRLEAEGWRLEAGGWRLEAVGWRAEVEANRWDLGVGTRGESG